MSHSPEPWVQVGTSVYCDATSFRAQIVRCYTTSVDADRANAERIVSCVNAMTGIPDPQAFVQAAKEAIERVKDE